MQKFTNPEKGTDCKSVPAKNLNIKTKYLVHYFGKTYRMTRDSLMSEIIAVLNKFGIEKIILFGSYAYGTPNPDSDIDLLVIKDIPENETRDFRLKLKKALWLKLGKLNYSFDLLVDNEQRIQKRIDMGDLFYTEIYSKGKIIYA
jgi:predicted nucleotidyltransferase